MDHDEIVRRLQPWRERHRRTAYTPLVREGDGSTTASKFAGMPWLAASEAWPVCGYCHQPMTFFLQVDLGRVPPELAAVYGDGLLQLFYCTACNESGWEPFTKQSLVRIVTPSDAGSTAMPRGVEQFPPLTIVDWEGFDDYPSLTEHRLLGMRYSVDRETRLMRVECDDPPFVADGLEPGTPSEDVAMTTSGEELGGWPFWVQDVEYPDCPRCSRTMHLVFQVDSEQNIPFMFGDAGIGHITQCPEHREVVAFGWACY